MTRPASAYTSVVVSRGHLLIGCGLAVMTALLPRLLGPYPIWVSVLTGVLVMAVAVEVSIVRLAVGPDRIVLGLGLIGSGRRIPTADIATSGSAVLSRGQAFGLGVPWAWKTTRMTVCAGPALVFTLLDGEVVRVSTPRPDEAIQIIERRNDA